MSKKTMGWLITAISLIIVGCMLFGGVMMTLNFDFTKLSTRRMETNSHTIEEPFENITILTDTADILLVPAERVSVECYEEANAKHTVSVNNGNLVIEIDNQTKWYEHIGFNFKSPKITVYIPQGLYGTLSIKGSTGKVYIPEQYSFGKLDVYQSTGDVTCLASVSGDTKVRTSTGDIHIADLQAGTMSLSVSTGRITASNVQCKGEINISVSTGKIKMTNVSCKNLITCGNTGDINLENVVAEGKLSIERTTGDVKFEGCDANQITVITDTGNVTGTLLSEKVFFCRTDTGSVDVPKSTTGGMCEITTDTGDIRLKVMK